MLGRSLVGLLLAFLRALLTGAGLRLALLLPVFGGRPLLGVLFLLASLLALLTRLLFPTLLPVLLLTVLTLPVLFLTVLFLTVLALPVLLLPLAPLLLLRVLHGLLQLLQRLVNLLVGLSHTLGAGLRFFLFQTLLQLLHIVLQILRPVRQFLGHLLRRVLLVLTVRRAQRIHQVALLLGQLFRLVLERLHLPFQRGALEHLDALLQLLAQLALLLGQVLQRTFGFFGRHVLRGLFQFAQLLLQLRRQSLAQQLLRFTQPLLQRTVERAGLLQLLFQIFGCLLKLLHAIGQLPLLFRKLLGLLGGLVGHRVLSVFPVLPRLRLLALPGSGRVRRALVELLLRVGGRHRLGHGRIGGRAHGVALFAQARQPQHEFCAGARLAPGRGVGRDGHELHGVARRERRHADRELSLELLALRTT